MTATPTVMFCVGAQKAGTRWLYNYLDTHPDCDFSALKELHYFDMLEKLNPNRLKRLRARVAKLRLQRKLPPFVEFPKTARKRRDAELWLKTFDGKTPVHEKYLDYLLKGRNGARIVGDITPAYATLSEASFRQMVNLAPRTKFVFTMRDPMDRLWSAIRMHAEDQSNAPDEFARMAFEEIDQFLAGKRAGIIARCDYATTLERLKKVVPSDDLHVEFYETLFTPEAIRRLTDFLGIAAKDAQTERISNRGKSLKLDHERAAKALDLLRPQYEYVAEQYGETIPDRWLSRMAEMS